MTRYFQVFTKQITRLQATSSTASTIPQCLQSHFSTAASLSTKTGSSTPPPSPSSSSLHEQYRKDILDAALQNVPQYGWTEDAIAHSIVSNKKYPPSFIGMMDDNHSKASELIHYFMKECNLKLKMHLEHLHSTGTTIGKKDGNGTEASTSPESSTKVMTHAELLEYGVKHRLEMVLPFVQSNRWSEGMALGATPYNAMSTASHLEELVSTLEQALLKIPSSKSTSTSTSASASASATNLSPLERTAIGAVYVTTELHLLADTSPGYQDTWKFLHDRIQELDWIQRQQFLQGQNGGIIPQVNQDTITAGVAVASSLGSGKYTNIYY